MKRLVIFCMIIFIINFPLSKASAGETKDIDTLEGNYWNDWNSTTKSAFVLGFMTGIFYIGDSEEKFNASTDPEKVVKKGAEYWLKWQQAKNNTEKIFTKEDILSYQDLERETNASRLQWRYMIYDSTVGQLREGLDILYKDFKNRNIKLADAIYVIRQQIKGTSAEDIERILLYLRNGKQDSSILEVKDEKGNYRSIPFPQMPTAPNEKQKK